MRRSGSRTLLLLGAVVALAVALVVYVVLASGGSGSTGKALPTVTPTLVKVVAAVNDMAPFTVVTSDSVTLKDVDQTTVLTTTATSPSEVIGMMTTRAYRAGDTISKAPADLQQPGLSKVLPKGLRAFGFAIQEVNTFNQGITDNDTVDILWTREFEVTAYTQPPTGGPPDKVTQTLATAKTLLQNIRVLRVISLKVGSAQASNGPVNASGGGNASDEQRAQQQVQASFAADAPPTMVLILGVTDQDAEVIKFARENGKVDLALRAADDTEPERTTGITDKILVDDYRVVLPEILVR